MPGPGAYYNPKQQSSFKTGKIPERLQFFGSTVERFSENKPGAVEPATVGPGTYTVNNLINYHKKSNPAIYSGFTSTEQRFTDHAFKMLTPGPGQYQAKTIASEMHGKVTSKSGVFGSTQRRFVNNAHKEALPGPGQYQSELVVAPGAASKAQTAAARNREKLSRSQPSILKQKQQADQAQAQSYIDQKQQAIRNATKNYKNQI